MVEEMHEVLRFWFGEPRTDLVASTKRWFSKDAAFDEAVRERFSGLMERAQKGELDAWATGDDAARGSLALIILLDQMSRNAYRGSARSFAQDGRALAFCLGGLGSGLDRELTFAERYMFLMPLMHAEDASLQQRGVTEFGTLAFDAEQAGASDGLVAILRAACDYAVKHADIVKRFGRFPHRNDLLGRPSTPEEVKFLSEPGSSF
jgi:uncharacterized protein (DUF924 family)